MQKRILIVGAGPGGLASAMLLAKAGIGVTVIERMPRVGGRTSTIEAHGFRFDMGPTFFLYPPVLEQIFADVGYELRSEVDPCGDFWPITAINSTTLKPVWNRRF